jgi:predicted nucleic acid-binding protein
VKRLLFADTSYWVALVNRHDQWHVVAMAATRALGSAQIVTTEEVLTEFLNALSAGGWLRQAAVEHVRRLRANPNVKIVPQTPDSFAAGFALYERRRDKEYGLTDCISMETRRQLGITEALTHDHHFQQEGFVALLRR